MRRAFLPMVAAAIGLLGSLSATFFLHRNATDALDRVLEERLRGAGTTAALWLPTSPPTAGRLQALMAANNLDGAYVLNRSLNIVADASGPPGGRADLLRVDVSRVQKAFRGETSIAPAYSFGDLNVLSGYFPLRTPEGDVGAVLALEAGQAFVSARGDLRRALLLGIALSLLTGLAVAGVATGWLRTERLRREDATRLARGEVISRMAAMVAHEIRNPLAVIRGTIELMRERGGPSQSDRDRSDFNDLLGQVKRLRGLTEDFLDLSVDRPLAFSAVNVAELLSDAARGCEHSFPSVQVSALVPSLPLITVDPGRLLQVFANLLSNSAQAMGQGKIELSAQVSDGVIQVLVRDNGPGIPQEIRERLFDPFVTSKAGGTGLGLAISKRIVERHRGTLQLCEAKGPGTTFEVRLPIREES
jgi:signal transduction histidine kinase